MVEIDSVENGYEDGLPPPPDDIPEWDLEPVLGAGKHTPDRSGGNGKIDEPSVGAYEPGKEKGKPEDVMVRQDFPFPTVLSLRGDAADKEAEAEALRYEAAVRDAVAELKDVHAERAYLAQAARVQQALRDVYRRYAELALPTVQPRAGRG